MAEMRLKVPVHQFPHLLGLMAYLDAEYEMASDFDETTREYEIPLRWVSLIPDMMPAVEEIWAAHEKNVRDHDADDEEEKPFTRLDEFWENDDYDADNKAEVTLYHFLYDWNNNWEAADEEVDLLAETNFAVESFVNTEVGAFETVGDLLKYLGTFDPTAPLELLESDEEIYLNEIPWPIQGGKKLRIATEEL